jgi:hypothetical protein
MSVRITQERVEIVRQGNKPGARVTQEVVEQINHPDNTQNMRVTQEVIEQVNRPNNTQNMRMTQEVIEVVFGPLSSGFIWNPWLY